MADPSGHGHLREDALVDAINGVDRELFDPAALVEAIGQVQAERSTAQAEIDSAPRTSGLDAVKIHAMIDSAMWVWRSVPGSRQRSERLYQELDLAVRYELGGRPRTSTARPVWDSACVRGDLRTDHTVGHRLIPDGRSVVSRPLVHSAADSVARIMHERAAGASWSAIARGLETDRVPTAQGGARW